MKFISIGDIHGSNRWKLFLFGTFLPTLELMDKVMKTIDKVVFIGDYVDSFTLTNEEIIQTLKEIIEFKKRYEDKVVLLWGNHDVYYYTMNYRHNVSGIREEMLHDLNQLFSPNFRYFQMAYQYENYLWTHAGIHRGWWEHYVRPKIKGKKESRFYKYLDGSENIADVCNLMWELQDEDIFMCSAGRTKFEGGIVYSNKVGGPLWASRKEITEKPLFGYHQIVGHTNSEEIKVYKSFGLEENDTSVTIIDCLPMFNELYTLEI